VVAGGSPLPASGLDSSVVGAYVPLVQARGDTIDVQIKEVRARCGACGAFTAKRWCAASFCGVECFQPHRAGCRRSE
jgi:hypothetical protein